MDCVACHLTIKVGDLAFTARWEDAAPRTRAALQTWLPMRERLIHCRWSGESTWIPFGDRPPDVGYENQPRTRHPDSRSIHTGELSECEILFPYGASLQLEDGAAGGQSFRTLTSGI